MIDTAGRTLGQHSGIHHFTVGQRKGLGISSPAPLFVVAIDAAARTVVVGSKEELLRKTLHASGVSWVAGAAPERSITAAAQIRYRHIAAAATIEPRWH